MRNGDSSCCPFPELQSFCSGLPDAFSLMRLVRKINLAEVRCLCAYSICKWRAIVNNSCPCNLTTSVKLRLLHRNLRAQWAILRRNSSPQWTSHWIALQNQHGFVLQVKIWPLNNSTCFPIKTKILFNYYSYYLLHQFRTGVWCHCASPPRGHCWEWPLLPGCPYWPWRYALFCD